MLDMFDGCSCSIPISDTAFKLSSSSCALNVFCLNNSVYDFDMAFLLSRSWIFF